MPTIEVPDGHTLYLRSWDQKAGRYRWAIGEVGIDGIEAGAPYRAEIVDGKPKLVKVETEETP